MKQAGYSESDVRQMISSFEKDNPKIKVKPTFVSYEALHDKIVTSAAAGTYDVELIDVIWPAEFASKGLIADVTKRFPDSWKSEMLGGRPEHRGVRQQVLRRAVGSVDQAVLLQLRDVEEGRRDPCGPEHLVRCSGGGPEDEAAGRLQVPDLLELGSG
ncbi:extracellular solute-binding protein [Nocardioides panacis]|uniref:Extracellular solute-binding protein n=1 Tax=Nocardioides panacis TaxID=2849501 RepID=A0A975Y260_9ACTN|nr:extracellular solute-binding protein [Nocardioides panacis]